MYGVCVGGEGGKGIETRLLSSAAPQSDTKIVIWFSFQHIVKIMSMAKLYPEMISFY